MNSPESPDRRTLLKNALVALEEMQAKLNRAEQAKHEPIAIIGMSCRLPGGANDPEAFWQLLCDSQDVIQEIPEERWKLGGYQQSLADSLGKEVPWYGGLLNQIDQFDPHFFDISPREAISIDPQQRLVLEVSWEALERAGQAPDRLKGSQTGMFLGISNSDYVRMTMMGRSTNLDIYAGTGGALSVAAGRVSYTLGLQGPAVSVDTACSSSLVAIHQACQSLRGRECDMALAGGVNAILRPEAFVCFSRWGMMASDGRCKTFDAKADGFVRSEGCGMIVMKRLSDAIANGDNILAVIRGSAVNQDGHSSGLTVPSGLAQQAVLDKALKEGKVAPANVSYVEAHGTGTALGDPIEIEALGNVLGKGRADDQPLIVSSVKTNIGHLESAAGVAGLMKVVLALQHQEIPPHLHLQERNPRIPWSRFPIQIPTESTPWMPQTGSRIAGVNAFGFSGTNAHVVLEEAPRLDRQPSEIERPLHLLTLSAKTASALQQLVERYKIHLKSNPGLNFADICFTGNTGRSQFNHRLSLVAASTIEAAEKLTDFATHPETPGIFLGLAGSGQPPIAFLFTGQGSQYVGMAQQLYQTQPTFRQTIDLCAKILHPYLKQSLIDILYPPTATGDATALLDQTAFTQPALFAVEYALATLWQSWGIQPDIVMGHSVGEYVAACVAGVFSLEDGLKLIAERGRLMQALPADGAMVAVLANEARVNAILHAFDQAVAIAALNGPESLVLSGRRDAIDKIRLMLETEGIKVTPLQVSHAFHSPLMEPMLAEFERVAATVQYSTPKLDIISNVTGNLATDAIATPQYWCRHVRQPVRFAEGMQKLHQQGYQVFLEIGPKPVLLNLGKSCLPPNTGDWLASLRSAQSDWQTLLESAAQLYVQGVSIDWQRFEQAELRQRVILPTYPFERKSYWIDLSNASPMDANAVLPAQDHPLLGNRLHLARSQEVRFEARVSPESPAFLGDHRLFETTVVPGTAYVEMALAAGARVLHSDSVVLESLLIQQALILPDHQLTTLQLILSPIDSDQHSYSFEILSLTESGLPDDWMLHASGKILAADEAEPAQIDLTALPLRDTQPMDVEGYYRQFEGSGINYGMRFKAVHQAWQVEGTAFGQIRLPKLITCNAGDYQLHPVLLDACFQVLGSVLAKQSEHTYLPIAIRRLRVYRHASTSVWCRAQLQAGEATQETMQAALTVWDETGAVVAQLDGLLLKRINQQTLLGKRQPNLDDWLYRVIWQPKAQTIDPSKTPDSSRWLIFADQGGLGQQIAAALTERGDRCVLVSASHDYEQIQPDTYQINPANPADFDRLIQASTDAALPYRGVIHLWSLDHSTEPAMSLAALQASQIAGCGSLLHLTQALARMGVKTPPRLYLTTRGAQAVKAGAIQIQQAPLWGLGKVIGLEHPDLQPTLLDLDPVPDQAELSHLMQAVLSPDTENQVAWRQGTRYVARLVRDTSTPTPVAEVSVAQSPQPFHLKLSHYGLFENLKQVPLARKNPQPGEVEIQVRSTGLNFRDVLHALGMLEQYESVLGIQSAADVPFGFECAGTITAIGSGVTQYRVGDPVLAMAAGSLASFVTVDANLVMSMPDNISFEAAATIPIAFLTAYYGLHQLANLRAGDRVLIHSAAGGVGQAAVQLAQQIGAEVFATASPGKWEFLQAMGVQHIMNSRTLDFAEEVLAITKGQGVDVVLNSLNGDFIPKSLEVLAPQGRFIEIGKIGIWDADQVKAVRPEVSYFSFDLGDIAKNHPDLTVNMFQHLTQEVRQGSLQPLPHRVFAIEAVVDAFTFLARAKQIGKVVVSLPQLPPVPADITIRSDSSYLITGGLGALGLQVAQWLATQGAGQLILISRRSSAEADRAPIQQLELLGCQVQVVRADVADPTEVADAVNAIQSSPFPLKGIVHAAGVLDDGVLAQQTWERFERVMAPKLAGTWNLHHLTQTLPLDFFVCFSSASVLLGSPGQGNYAAANAFMDAIAHYRQSLGLPGLSINWGAWSDVGMAAALNRQEQRRIFDRGLEAISPEQGLQILGQLLKQDSPQVGVMPIHWAKFSAQFSATDVPCLLSELVQPHPASRTVRKQAPTKPAAILPQIRVASPENRLLLLTDYLSEQVAKTLGFKLAQLDVEESLNHLGLDSVMAVELMNRVKTDLEVDISIATFLEGPSISSLATQIAAQTDTEPIGSPPPRSTTNDKALDEREEIEL